MRKSIMLAAFLSLFSCVTPQPTGDSYRFPDKFFAVQEVTIRMKEKTIATLLAQISHSENQSVVVFLEPLWQRPILRVSGNKNGDPSVTWYMNQASELGAHIPAFYQSMNFIFNSQTYPDFKRKDSQGGEYVLQELKLFGGCKFPNKILIDYRGVLKVEVTSSQVSCG
jgi:hypothetical protein